MSKKPALFSLFLVLTLGLTAGVTGASEIKINFQSAGAPIPEGYLPEYGELFSEHDNGWSYGWNQSITSGARDRNNANAPDQRYDTLNHFRGAIWEIEVPNGTYNLFIVCGDPSYIDQTNNIDVEGTLLQDPDDQAGDDFDFDEFEVTVEVTDGRLTIQPGEGQDNSKICFIDIESAALTRFFKKARDPNPVDGAQDVVDPILMWTPGDTADHHKVYLGTDPDNLVLVSEQDFTVYWHPEPIEGGIIYYWRIDEVEADGNIITGDLWTFMALSQNAWGPSPADGAKDVMIDTQLSWQEGDSQLPMKHHLYFGTDETQVAEGTGDTDKGILEATKYAPGLLQGDTIYYFRVDEVEMFGNIRQGKVWSFKTVEPGPGRIIRELWFDISGSAVANLTGNIRYPDDPDVVEFVSYFQNPEDWAEQFGTRIRGWIFAPETGNYKFMMEVEDAGEIRLSTDEDPANAVTIVSTDGSAESTPQALVAGSIYYIEALMKENTIGDSLVVSWQRPGHIMEVISSEFIGATPYQAVKAYAAKPADGAVNVNQKAVLTWSPGLNAASHQVYFGSDADAMVNADTSSPEYKGTRNLGSESYEPEEMPWNTTYYWRVDEVETGGTVLTGTVWSFTTANFLIVDDMESYNDINPDEPDSNRIFNAWIDGYGDPANGSLVGNDNAPFAEQTIVHDGRQSMPFAYDNTTAGKSEATLTLADTRNWTQNGVSTMAIWYIGAGANAADPMYVVLNNTAVAVNDNFVAAQVLVWTEWTIDLQTFADQGVDLTNVNTITLGFGDRTNPVAGGTGTVFFDDIRLYAPAQ
ncbi:MAG: hypothetical protein JW837_18905 [Sedimentisphaerales bacterium]|nr:hypothetical protein [Sedimentisphaerales bacterium]